MSAPVTVDMDAKIADLEPVVTQAEISAMDQTTVRRRALLLSRVQLLQRQMQTSHVRIVVVIKLPQAENACVVDIICVVHVHLPHDQNENLLP